MLERTQDVDRINEVVNHPSVRPSIGAPEIGKVDVSALVTAPEHWFLIGEHGGFMLGWSAPEVREIHTFILPEGRGKWAAQARDEMLTYAREHGTKLLWTKIEVDARHVEHFARQGGMQLTEEVIETLGVPYRIYRLELA
jgi:hypothetical protein